MLQEFFFVGYVVETRKDNHLSLFVLLADGGEDIYTVAIG